MVFDSNLILARFKFIVAIFQVYWNSRLSHEHERLASSLEQSAILYDACAGIGPFVFPVLKRPTRKVSIQISLQFQLLRVFANDLNPESIRWLNTNRKLNKVGGIYYGL